MEYPKQYTCVVTYNCDLSAVIVGQDTLEGTMNEALKSAAYLSHECGYTDVAIEKVTVGCKNCYGSGFVVVKGYKTKKCPICKGKGTTRKVN